MDKTRKKIIKFGIMIIFLFVFFICDRVDAKAGSWIVPTNYSNYGDTSRWPYDSKYATNTESALNYHDRKIYLQLYNCTWNKSGYYNYVYYWIKDSNGNPYYEFPYFERKEILKNTNTYNNGVTTLHKHYMPEVQIAGATPSIPTGYVFTRDGYNYYLNLTASAASISTYYYDYYSSKDGTKISYVAEVGTSKAAEDYLVGFRFEIDTNPTGTSVGSSSAFQGVSTVSSSLDINVSDYFKSGTTYYIHVRAESYTGLLGAQLDLPISSDSLKKNLTITADDNINSTNGSGSYYPGVSGIDISATAKTGYQFSSWSYVSGGGVSFENSVSAATKIKTMPDSDVTIKANSRANQLTINFDANGGNNAPSAKVIKYDKTAGLPTSMPTKSGYVFKGWSLSSTWSDSDTKWWAGGSKTAQDWASTFGKDLASGDQSVTLYAQWARTVTYAFKYWDGNGGATAKVSATWYNSDSSNKTVIIPDDARGNKTRLGQTWTFDGFDADSAYRSSGSCDIASSTYSLTLSPSDSSKNYYAKYHTTVKMTYVDYGTDKQITRTDSKVAYMNWNYSSHTEPSFTTFTENTMKFTEASARCTHGYDSANGDDNSTTGYTRCSLCKQETWSSSGWAFENTASNAKINYAQGATVVGNASGHNNVNRTLYGRYSKTVTLTYNYNGGTKNKANDVYTRNANAYNVEAATTTSFILPSTTYITNGVTKYNLGAWTGTKVTANNDFYTSPSTYAKTNIVGKNTSINANNGENFKFVPRVSDTIYASWTNQTAQTAIEPKVTVVKSVKWKTPTSDNSVVDYDNKQNIDIDGRAVVTLDITVENKNSYQLTNFSVNDYINTDMWTYIGNVSKPSGINGFKYTQANGGIYFTVADSSSSKTYKVTYEIQLKENYWNVNQDTKLYINKHQNLSKYLAALTNETAYSKYNSANNYNSTNGLINYSNMYYCESQDAEKSFVIANYTIKNGTVRGTRRNVHYSTPYLVIRPVNWKTIIDKTSNKELSQITIQNGTNVYHNIDSDYKNTYFVQYDTKSTDSSNSTFNIYSNSSIRRSYDYYQITDNLLDIRTTDGKNQVIDNSIGLNVSSSTTVKDSTSTDANTTKGEALKISAGQNTHNAVTVTNNVKYYTVKEVTAKIVAGGNVIPAWIGQRASEAEFKKESETTINGKPAIIWTKKVYQSVINYTNGTVTYPYGGLTSVNTFYATNQDGLEMNIYPYVRTTNSKLNETYETTRDTSILQNQRLNVTIDASDPIITPDSQIHTESDEYGEWTESDGYIDINLVNSATNPEAQTHKLVFKFEDEVSGINSPYATNEDWINTTSDNVHVTLKRVDNEEITIYDSEVDKTNANTSVIKVNYGSTTSMSKTGNVTVTLDPTNKNILGHLKLTIRVYDNVSNWTEKTYDLYVFCLTGSVEIVDTLPDYNARLLELNRFANGEMGYVKVSAGGYVDRVTLDFGEYLDNKYKSEYSKRKNFTSDLVKTINGDYPSTDATSLGAESGIDSSMTYLPYEWQVNTWGYTDDTLGGIKITKVKLDKFVENIDNSILQEHLSDLIERYQGMNQGTSYDNEAGSDYAIVDSTLYTYPVMNGDSITSYVHKYELGGETYYDDVLYPAYITLDGTKGITITYDSVQPDVEDSEDKENNEVENAPRRKIVASVEGETEISISSWVQDGNGYLKPFMHNFYMPMEAEEKTASDPYYVTLTSYKDSEKDFKHSVSIRLSFYNDLEPIHKKLETYIKDN